MKVTDCTLYHRWLKSELPYKRALCIVQQKAVIVHTKRLLEYNNATKSTTQIRKEYKYKRVLSNYKSKVHCNYQNENQKLN